jgi:Asp-tRNA(Asn)/Glu-tRNA(Gln) amidotransferase A subunit family amidase
MRVKIAYTVELEEVEKEVAEIMEKAANNLDKAYRQVAEIQLTLNTGSDDLKSKLVSIDAIRRKMMKADQVLEDCYVILEGYDHALKQIEEQENEIKTR